MNMDCFKGLRLSQCAGAMLLAVFVLTSTASYAENHDSVSSEKTHKKHEKFNKEEIMREISFLAKKLLDSSGEDRIVVESPAVMKPFIGVCSVVETTGVKLACITPASQAEKNGLKTGDVVVAMNGISLTGLASEKKDDHPYWGVLNNMNIGDVLMLDVLRGGETLKIKVTVGSLSHPAYELKVSRK